MSLMYTIPSLSIEQLNALQNAIVTGALNRHVRSLQLAIEANKGHPSMQDVFLKDLQNLQEAGRAIMAACPTGDTIGEKSRAAITNMCVIHHVYGYNTDPFQKAYIHAMKIAGYNWELLAADMPPVTPERGRSLS